MSLETRSRLRGYSYGRVSTSEQAFNPDGTRKEDGSLDAQENRCRNYVEELNKSSSSKVIYEIVTHLSDEAYSGKNTKRPGFQKLWKAIESKEIEFVVTPDLARLSRSVKDFLDFLDHCEKYKVDVVIIGMKVDTFTPMGRMFLTLISGLAQFEREMTVHRLKVNSLSRLINDGRINGTKETLGLDTDPNRKGHFIENKEELLVLQQILELYLTCSSKKKTLEEARKRGLKWKNGQDLTEVNINSIFMYVKYRYRGLWPINKDNKDKNQDRLTPCEKFTTVKLPHNALLDLRLLDEVQEKLTTAYKEKRKSYKNHTYLLTSLLKHEDGSTFIGHPAKQNQYRYYYNSKNTLRIRCDEIDPLIVNRLREYFKESSIFEKLVDTAFRKKQESLPKIREEVSSLRAENKKLNNEEDKLKQSFLNLKEAATPEFMNWLQDEVKKVSNEKHLNEQRIENLKLIQDEILSPISTDNISEYTEMLLNQFTKLTGTQKRRYVEKIFERIIVKGTNEIELHFKTGPLKPLGEKGLFKDLSGGTSRT